MGERPEPRTYCSRGRVRWGAASEAGDGESQGSNSSLVPLLGFGKRLHSGSSEYEDGGSSRRRLLTVETREASWCSSSSGSRPHVAAASNLAASGKSQSELDGLLYLIDGAGSADQEIARASALSVARAVKSSATRDLVR